MKKIKLKPLTRETKIKLICIIIAIGFITAVIYHNLVAIFYSEGYPFNTFLYRPRDRFADFIHWYNLSHNGNPYFDSYNYPFRFFSPSLFLVGYMTGIIGLKAALYIFLMLFILFFLYVAYRNIKCDNGLVDLQRVFVFSLLSYPFLFAIDRANLEILIFIILYLSVWLFYKKKFILSAIILSIAISFKAIPAILLVLFLSKKRYKEIFISIFVTIGLTISSLLILKGSPVDNISRLLTSFNHYTQLYAIDNQGLFFGHSLFGLLKIFLASSFPQPSLYLLKTKLMLSYYFWFSIFISAFIVIYVVLIEKQFWKKITILIFIMDLLPYVSADYRLLHIFIPLFFFINKKEKDNYDLIYLLLFAFLLVPKNYYNFDVPNLAISREANLGVVINPLIMSAMVILIVINGVRKYKLKHNSAIAS